MTQYPQDPNRPQFQPAPQHNAPKKHPVRNVFLIVGGGLVALIVIVGIFSPSGSEAPAANLPNVVTTSETPTPSVAPTEPAEVTAPVASKPSLTNGQEQAIGSAESYLAFTAFSRKGLIHQLSSEAGEGFSVADATYAVDHIKVDWNEQAAKAARSYLEMTHFSRQGLIHQLESSAGDGFTHKQAVYGVTKAGL
jgi:hypothetical protein